MLSFLLLLYTFKIIILDSYNAIDIKFSINVRFSYTGDIEKKKHRKNLFLLKYINL